jgi:uroporphyrin-III C-methyltransferase / precorrin-2 dehydrogenase / sirohydrochlorin ferrochelatase
VRLKAGDPFVLGRGGEEALALIEARVPFEIVPGISAAVAAPAAAGIPVTHRGVASAFVVVSGHAPEAYRPVLASLPSAGVTVVVLMGFAERGRIADCLIAGGWPSGASAAVISNATQDSQVIWTGPLASLGAALGAAPAHDAHTIVIGEVVSVGAVIARGMWTSESRRAHASGSEDVGPRPTVICA